MSCYVPPDYVFDTVINALNQKQWCRFARLGILTQADLETDAYTKENRKKLAHILFDMACRAVDKQDNKVGAWRNYHSEDYRYRPYSNTISQGYRALHTIIYQCDTLHNSDDQVYEAFNRIFDIWAHQIALAAVYNMTPVAE